MTILILEQKYFIQIVSAIFNKAKIIYEPLPVGFTSLSYNTRKVPFMKVLS